MCARIIHMSPRKEFAIVLWDLAREQAQTRWDQGYFDKNFRLKTNPRFAMEIFKVHIDRIEIEEDGRVLVIMVLPSSCGCCAADECSFVLTA